MPMSPSYWLFCAPVLCIPLARVASCCNRMGHWGVRMLICWVPNWIDVGDSMLFWFVGAVCPIDLGGNFQPRLPER
jgi:hypothetical protein